MRRIMIGFAAVAMMCASGAPSAWAASLLGTQVNGVMNVSSDAVTNYFDPVNGWVPAGYGNSSSPNNVVIGSGVEFGYSDGANTDTADFSDTQLTLMDVSDSFFRGSLSVAYIFTDTAFIGKTISSVSDDFPSAVIASIVGDVLTLNMPAFEITQSETFQATFDIAGTTPLPAALPLFMSGCGVLGLFAWRRKKKPAALAV